MDVRLPNGNIIRGVPDGTPRSAIAFKAITNGLARPEDFGYESSSGPTEGMSGFEKFRAGYGKAAVDLGRGVTQAVGLMGSTPAAVLARASGFGSREAVAESRKRDAPLMETGPGKAGYFSGAVANALPAAAIPGANTMAGAAGVGAGLGFLQPSASTGETVANTAIGGALSPAALLAGRGLASLWRAGKATVEPFFKGGQDRIAARTLQAFAGGSDEAARAAQSIDDALAQPMLKGVEPTTAELAQNAGIAQFERSLRNNPEMLNALAERMQGNRTAMVSALDDIAGTPQMQEAATAVRSAATKPLYEAADSMTVHADDQLNRLLTRPSMKAAWDRAANLAREAGEELDVQSASMPDWLKAAVSRAKQTAAQGGTLSASQRRLQRVMGDPAQMRAPAGKAAESASGMPTSFTGRTLHYLKMAMDDLADNPQVSGIGANEANAIRSTRTSLLEWMEKKLPTYGMGRKLYTALSKPINRMEIGRALRDKLQPALADFGATTRTRGEMYASALREGDDFAARTLGRGSADLSEIMTPRQMEKLKMIGEQLARRVNADELGRAAGSNTSQNLLGQNLMRQLLGPLGLPESTIERAAQSTLLQSIIGRPSKWIGQIGEERVLETLARASLDPKVAKEMLRVGIDPMKIGLLPYYQGLAGPAAVSGANAARQ